MVKLDRIYTRGGDTGETSLVGGVRVAKTSLRIAAIGDIDETNAAIGVACALARQTKDPARLGEMLHAIQNDLFDLGADIATPHEGPDREPLRISAAQVLRLEREIDAMNVTLEPLASFILPGGTRIGAQLHLARAVTRRAERAICALAAAEGVVVSEPARQYINRLSDYLFTAARIANAADGGDILWVPGAHHG